MSTSLEKNLRKPWVKIRKTNLDGESKFTGVSFYLSQQLLEEIRLAKQPNIFLEISFQLRQDLYQYIFLNLQENITFGINFCTYYHYQEDDKVEEVIQTVIYFDGNIKQEIKKSSLSFPELTLEIIEVHYKLIKQLFVILGDLEYQDSLSENSLKYSNQNSFKNILQNKFKYHLKSSLNWFSWGISSLIVAISIIVNIEFFKLNLLFLFLPIIMILLLQWGIKKLLFFILKD